MKKIIALMLALAICLAFAGCNFKSAENDPEPTISEEPSNAPEGEAVVEPETENNEEETPATDVLIINSEPYVIDVERGFENAGFTELYVDYDGTFTFTAKDSENVEWSVYVLDEKFEDNARFIPQAFEAALVGDGTLEIKAGQYLYVCCSVSSFTADEVIEGPTYEIS